MEARDGEGEAQPLTFVKKHRQIRWAEDEGLCLFKMRRPRIKLC